LLHGHVEQEARVVHLPRYYRGSIIENQ
jgi:hypothetical protein